MVDASPLWPFSREGMGREEARVVGRWQQWLCPHTTGTSELCQRFRALTRRNAASRVQSLAGPPEGPAPSQEGEPAGHLHNKPIHPKLDSSPGSISHTHTLKAPLASAGANF